MDHGYIHSATRISIKNKENAMVDALIQPIVKWINGLSSAITISSCQGDPDSTPLPRNLPQVSFRSDNDDLITVLQMVENFQNHYELFTEDPMEDIEGLSINVSISSKNLEYNLGFTSHQTMLLFIDFLSSSK